MKYTVRKGDSLIKIARAFGLNSLDEIIKANKISNPNLIKVGQVLELPEPEFYDNIDAAGVTAKKQDYSRTPAYQLPSSTQVVDMSGVHYANPDKEAYTRANEQQIMYGYGDKARAYAQAVNDGKLTINQVPEQYRQQAYNQSIRNTTDTAAPYAGKWILGAPFTVPDLAVRSTLSEGRKLASRAMGNDTSSDYGWEDYFGNFSWLGKNFEEEHPVADAIINTVTTPAVMVVGENLAARSMDGALNGAGARMMSNARATGRAMGLEETRAPEPAVRDLPGRQSGYVYRGSTTAKGQGKTGTATRGARGGYSANSSSKGAASNSSSYVGRGEAPAFQRAVEKEAPAAPFFGTGYWHGFPVYTTDTRVPYAIVEPQEEHIEEVVPIPNKWIYGPETESKAPYKEGQEHLQYITAQAPSGKTVKEQPIHKESIKKKEGNAKRSATERNGKAEGSTPSGWFSGYGFTYGTGSGPWLRKNGGKIVPKSLVQW